MITISAPIASQLASDACDAIRNEHERGWRLMPKGPGQRFRWEPRFVGHLCVSMKDVAAAWRPTLRTSHPGLHLNLSCIFTHQTPYVNWATSHARLPRLRCELADLLIVYIDKNAAQPGGVATLIQAKQSDTGSVSLTNKSEKLQFHLLSSRPSFDVEGINAPSGVNLSGLTPDRTLVYGLTPPDAMPPSSPSWSPHRWELAMGLQSVKHTYSATGSECLAETMVEMLQGNRGWRFDLPPKRQDWKYFSSAPNRDDWSMLINHLLKRSFSSPVKVLQTAGRSGGYRRSNHRLYLKSRTPSGASMFFLADGDESARPTWLDWVNAPPSLHGSATEDWRECDEQQLMGENGDDIVQPPQSPVETDEGGNGGPISVVCFEFSRSENE